MYYPSVGAAISRYQRPFSALRYTGDLELGFCHLVVHASGFRSAPLHLDWREMFPRLRTPPS